MERTNPKMKHSTLSNSEADVFTKVISLESSWMKILYGDNFQEWKTVPSNIIKTKLQISPIS